MPTIDRPEPPYMQVVRHVRDQIRSGQLAEGDAIPSARQLAASFNIALATATKALATLRAEGLVRGVPGIGTVVHTRGFHRSSRDRSESVLHTGRIYPEGHYAKIRSAELVLAPDHVVDALGLKGRVQVIRRHRTTFDTDDIPLSTSVSWFDGALADVAPLLLEPNRILQGTYRYVEERTGRIKADSEKLLISAGGATTDEARELMIPPGTPVLRGRNFYWDTDFMVIEYGESTAREGLETIIEFNVNSEAAK
jgi:DNA-binding GntR family transcriptional regulator